MNFASKEHEENAKRTFAAAILRNPMDSIGAANLVTSNPFEAQYIANEWFADPDVCRYMSELKQLEGTKAQLPSKDEFAVMLLTEVNNARGDLRLEYYKLAAKVLGYTDVPNKANAPAVSVNQSFILLPREDANVDEWSERAKKQQARLIDAA